MRLAARLRPLVQCVSRQRPTTAVRWLHRSAAPAATARSSTNPASTPSSSSSAAAAAPVPVGPRRLSFLSAKPQVSILGSLTRGWPLAVRSRSANGAGVGLFATRDLPEGMVVFEESPLASVADMAAEYEEYKKHKEWEQMTDKERKKFLKVEGQQQPPVRVQLCSLCGGTLDPPLLVEPGSGILVPPTEEQWQQLKPHVVDLFDPKRAPIVEPVPCRTCPPETEQKASKGGEKEAEKAYSCPEHYCSPVCEAAAWTAFHAHEHLASGDVSLFDNEDINALLRDVHKHSIVMLLMRVVATMTTEMVAPVGGASASAAAAAAASSATKLSVLDHLSHLSVLRPTPTGNGTETALFSFTDAEVRALERAVGPLLQRVILASPGLLARVRTLLSNRNVTKSSTVRPGDEGAFLAHQLLGALVSNSFALGRVSPTLLQAEMEQHDEEEEPPFDDTAAMRYYAALYSLAACMNHACEAHSNIAVELDPSAPFAHPNPELPVSRALAAPGSLLPPAGRAPPTRFATTRDIRAGEELLLTYTFEPSELPARYGFKCDCPSCMGGMEEGREQE